ncbi:ComEA family DNA-binding protein [Pseudobutyrivibrio sp.]|uniref:ComEA family DNA-binding protein n=1 Tax=Pseudobutyrivibrio sp. TaxID=2014367 RepID=UPI001DFC38CE|nr:ComEA family DNA-binding protein [Pseudobutyrivibrio sp.]MBE5911904.1 ComEA family DNA-binding protein [Pseudobutyrivibrio sp.]
MKKLFCLVCCSLFLFTGCGQKSYFQASDSTEVSQEKSEEELPASEASTDQNIFVQVSGAVVSPGVYELPGDSRVYAAIEAAGGLLQTADDSDINQAAILEDGQKIYVYSAEEMAKLQEAAIAEESANDGLVNINTADVQLLTTLPGIGENKAKQIVAYRDSNGAFSSIEDIKNVSGIGDGIFNQINSLIKI